MSTKVGIVLLLLAGACAGGARAADDGCNPSGGLEFVCGLKNPEDLVAVPGTKWILASGMAAGVGITLIDSRDGSHSQGYPGDSPSVKHDTLYTECQTPPDSAKLETHGLNLRVGANGRPTLYAVAHGARESIEVFDVETAGAKPKLTWKGCVPMPEGLAANSVASFADGGLVATVLLMPGKTFADSIARKPTGAVYEWAPGKHGFELMRGSELPGNNGIEVSGDGKQIFVVSSGLQTIVALAHANPTMRLGTTRPLPFTPDNVHMGPGWQVAHRRDEERRARVRRRAGTAARPREALDVPARLHCDVDRSRDDEGHAVRARAREPGVQQRDDGAAGRQSVLDRQLLGRPRRSRAAALTPCPRASDARASDAAGALVATRSCGVRGGVSVWPARSSAASTPARSPRGECC